VADTLFSTASLLSKRNSLPPQAATLCNAWEIFCATHPCFLCRQTLHNPPPKAMHSPLPEKKTPALFSPQSAFQMTPTRDFFVKGSHSKLSICFLRIKTQKLFFYIKHPNKSL
jgi:hypothetical protein